jgi:hypothetical protein
MIGQPTAEGNDCKHDGNGAGSGTVAEVWYCTGTIDGASAGRCE